MASPATNLRLYRELVTLYMQELTQKEGLTAPQRQRLHELETALPDQYVRRGLLFQDRQLQRKENPDAG